MHLLMSPKKFLNYHPKSILVLFQCMCIFINNVNSLQHTINNTNQNNNESVSQQQQQQPPQQYQPYQLSNFDNSFNTNSNSDNNNNNSDNNNSNNNHNSNNNNVSDSDDSERIIITTPKNSIPLSTISIISSSDSSSSSSSITKTPIKTPSSSPLNTIENIDSVNESYENISSNNNDDHSDRNLIFSHDNNNNKHINTSVPEIVNGTFRVPLGSLDVIIKEDVSYSDDSPDINNPQIHNLLENSKKIGDSCEGHKILPNVEQPQLTDFAKIKKCCPYGENYHYIINKNGSKDGVPAAPMCAKETLKFNAPTVKAIFYENCIEDTEEFIKLDYDIGNPCIGHSYLYNRLSGDLLYILQNGSLLRIEENYDNYDVFDDYCLDMNGADGVLSAIVCDPIFGKMVSVSKAQSYIYAICMLTSVPCLLITVFFYLAIPRLRNLHGKSLACHSMCLAIGFLLLSISQLKENIGQVTGYIVQYFILACFFWLTLMCFDICTQAWFFVPRKINLKPIFKWMVFIGYVIIAMGIPLILVLITLFKQLPGTPSYYLKGMTEATRSSQQFFIPPISSLLVLCFLLLIASFFGFRELNGIISQSFIIRMKERRNHQGGSNVNNINYYDFENFEEVKQVAKGTAYLYVIMTVNWIFEIISFYHDSSSDSLVLFDILNALQGVVIFIIFVCLPYQLTIIKHWWTDRGELHITNNMTELQELNKKSTATELTDLESNNKINAATKLNNNNNNNNNVD